MDLSIIIVNYNVKHFLEQCLHSVARAMEGIKGEVFIVDNNSVDGSPGMVKEKFPGYRLIENKENLGFAKANNQAIEKAVGRYILILNPDTILEENTLRKCIYFMDSHPDAGASGVKMIDGKGKFLPESKRALPTPAVAFYKIFGLAGLFPRSRIFGKYHLGYLDAGQTQEVDILSGAFMFLRKSVIDKLGAFDEDYFMYGEDIDLSYKILKGGYKNYYFPETRIIHYKGESTQKGSLNYVSLFYKAMLIFAGKHFSKKNIRLYSLLVSLAIYFRAGLSIVKRIFLSSILPLLDISLIYAGYMIITPVWGQMKFGNPAHYPDNFLMFVVPAYILVWLFSVYIFSAYRKPVQLARHIKGILAGSLVILIAYALLPNELRFSRALILIGSLWTLASTVGIRFLLSSFAGKNFKLYRFKKKRLLIAGKEDETERVKSLLKQARVNTGFIANVGTSELARINEMVSYHKIDEIIFCSKDFSTEEIIRCMIELESYTLEFKIAPPESMSLIGSSSKNLRGDLYLYEINSIGKKENRRKKRSLDIIVSLFLILSYPLTFIFVKNATNYFANILKVLSGRLSWTGYLSGAGNNDDLPALRPAVLTPYMGTDISGLSETDIHNVNIDYARDYSLRTDLYIISRKFNKLGS